MTGHPFITYLIHSFSPFLMSTIQSKNQSIQSEQITARARDLWQKSGSPEGRSLEFWLAAEAELQKEQEDVRQTQRGEINHPPRATPGGNEPNGKGPLRDDSQEKVVKKTRRVAASVK